MQTRDISCAINLCGKTNFNDYINTWRVDAVKKELATKAELSLLEIGLQEGFNCKTCCHYSAKSEMDSEPGRKRGT